MLLMNKLTNNSKSCLIHFIEIFQSIQSEGLYKNCCLYITQNLLIDRLMYGFVRIHHFVPCCLHRIQK